MKTQAQMDAEFAVSEYERLRADPYKAPEQIEEARQVAERALATSSECTCGDEDVPFCERHGSQG